MSDFNKRTPEAENDHLQQRLKEQMVQLEKRVKALEDAKEENDGGN